MNFVNFQFRKRGEAKNTKLKKFTYPKTFLNVLRTFNLHRVPRGYILLQLFCKEFANVYSLQKAFSFVICKNVSFLIASTFKVISF